MPRSALALLATAALLAASCASPPAPGEELWSALSPHCGQAFFGRLAEGTEASDAAFGESLLVARILECSEQELRIALDVGRDRSRTWIVTRTPGGVRLKHDHRHPDGSEDSLSRYGGDTRGATDGPSFDFYADSFTAHLIPRAATNIWTLSVGPQAGFSYGLRREDSGRRFRIEFDFARPAPAAE
jgi:hypothetical protein